MEYYFITGTSQGLGKALAMEALGRGGHVHGLSRTEAFQKDRYTHFGYDLADLNGMEEMAGNFLSTVGSPDRVVLINNAGTLGNVAYGGEWKAEELIRAFAVNLTAPVVLTNAFIKTFGDSDAEKIVINISSGASRNPYDGWSAYCSGKAGLEMYTRVLSVEIEKRQLRNFYAWSVAPGVVDTGMQDYLRTADPESFSNLDRFLDLKKENKLTPPEESAAKILSMLDNPGRFHETVQDIRKF